MVKEEEKKEEKVVVVVVVMVVMMMVVVVVVVVMVGGRIRMILQQCFGSDVVVSVVTGRIVVSFVGHSWGSVLLYEVLKDTEERRGSSISYQVST